MCIRDSCAGADRNDYDERWNKGVVLNICGNILSINLLDNSTSVNRLEDAHNTGFTLLFL